MEFLPVNKISPHQTEYYRAGEEKVEDGDLQFSNIEWEYRVAGVPRPKT